MAELIEWLTHMLEAPASTSVVAYSTAIRGLLEYHTKYRWHDLRKDPDDLPTADGVYLVAYKQEKYGTRLFLNGTFAFNYELKASLSNLIAWREIEPFL